MSGADPETTLMDALGTAVLTGGRHAHAGRLDRPGAIRLNLSEITTAFFVVVFAPV